MDKAWVHGSKTVHYCRLIQLKLAEFVKEFSPSSRNNPWCLSVSLQKRAYVTKKGRLLFSSSTKTTTCPRHPFEWATACCMNTVASVHFVLIQEVMWQLSLPYSKWCETSDSPVQKWSTIVTCSICNNNGLITPNGSSCEYGVCSKHIPPS